MSNKLNLSFIVSIVLLSSLSLSSQSVTAKFGKGLQILGSDSTFYMKVGFRFQSLMTADWSLKDTENSYERDFGANALIRRSRIKMDGWITSPKLKYKVELSLSNRDNGGGGDSEIFGNAANIILDAYVAYNFYNNFSIKFGQTKLAGNRERVISSANLQFVDRSRLNSRYTLDRDMFIQLLHHHTIGDKFLIRESASMGLGEGKNQIDGDHDGFNYTYRVEFLPFGKFQSKGDYVGSSVKREAKPKLSIGITYDNNNNSVRERGQKGSFIMDENGNFYGKDLNTIFVDLMYKHQGLSIMAEYADKQTSDNDPIVRSSLENVVGEFYTGSGYNVQAGYMFKNNFEIATRYTSISADLATDEVHYTLGLNKFFVGHKLKIQTDFSMIERSVNQNTFQWRAQMEVHF